MIETQPPGADTAAPPPRKHETTAANTLKGLAGRVRRFRLSLPWNSEDDWERPDPGPEGYRRDAIGVLIALLLSAMMLEFMRGFAFGDGDYGTAWLQHLAQAAIFLPLVFRRRFPIAVMLASSVIFVAVGVTVTVVSQTLGFQAAYFASLYSAVAWARNRRVLWLGVTVVIAAMFLWIILGLTVSSGLDELIRNFWADEGEAQGLFPPLTSYSLYTFMLNAAYFGGAIMFGWNSWRSAHQREQLAGQAVQLEAQSADLARKAVIEERLRIARELHDVVAHHISVIGIQAGAARRVLEKKPDAAAGALQTIESSSRDAVAEMRSLLGVLRSSDAETDGPARRQPEPGLEEIPQLLEDFRSNGLAVKFHRAGHEPGVLENLSAPLALSVYRTIQESLANIRRHSTAGSAVVALRSGTTPAGPDSPAQRWVEVETVDDGRPRHGTGGTGYGLRGIRERAALHGGITDIGPRDGGGWRVRVRFTLR
ncbi:sensor histidine kinase [Arthrobacter gandavensis]|uniref:sensor histidine kinase n=1 Tax=Arthrobacter gandavensis TaxID=169960 RepID=UPI00188F19FB|nr:histidine kinase [Arthrobacter gandavensis]MBF4994240.1 sensor histidine kinase [Arthrobacter gandavensis]